MKPAARRVLQAVLYEALALAVVAPALVALFHRTATTSFALAAVMSTIALAWNYVFNTVFERWEARRPVGGRPLGRRLLHGSGFEGGLTLILVPVIAAWLDVSLVDAFLANLGILAFFFAYAVAFTWAFDKLFGLPPSAAPR